MDRFALRVPATVQQEITRALTAAEEYIAGYNLRLDRVVDLRRASGRSARACA